MIPLVAPGGTLMRRREFIALAGGMAVLPLAARAQQSERMRRIGVLMNATENDPYGQARLAAFKQVLQQLGWSDGRNVRMDIRWGVNDVDLTRRYATWSRSRRMSSWPLAPWA